LLTSGEMAQPTVPGNHVFFFFGRGCRPARISEMFGSSAPRHDDGVYRCRGPARQESSLDETELLSYNVSAVQRRVRPSLAQNVQVQGGSVSDLSVQGKTQ
jgi:hypothetical protein